MVRQMLIMYKKKYEPFPLFTHIHTPFEEGGSHFNTVHEIPGLEPHAAATDILIGTLCLELS